MTTALRLGLPLIALLAGALSPAAAQNYPNRPITMIVPFATGGLTDVPARILAAMMQERIGQNIIVENKPGGSGTVGGAYAVRAAPDGYTLFANSIADAQNLHFMPVPYKSLAEMVADARANPNKISFGTSGPATSPAMALAQLNSLAKTEIVGVPYRGSGEAARTVAGGAIQGAFAFYAQAKPLADHGGIPRRLRLSAKPQAACR